MSFFNLTNQHLSQIEEVLNQIYTAHTFKSLLPESFVVTVKNFSLTAFWSLIFRAFDWNNHGQLTYQEVLSGVAAMDPSTPHGGPSGELRCRYIFRCYSAEQESCLSFEGFKWVVLLVLLDRLKMVLRDYHGLSMVKSSYTCNQKFNGHSMTDSNFFLYTSVNQSLMK